MNAELHNPPRACSAKHVLATLCLLAMSTVSIAATTPPGATAHATPDTAISSLTGDAWLDATLVDMNRYAARYPDAFVDELARYYGAPRDLVVQLLGTQQWTPGDIYFACALARVAGQPCRAVAALRTRTPGSWTTVAQQLGIGLGSPQFHRLKRGVVLSYEHWARPLRVDNALHAEFPKHPLYEKNVPSTDGAPATEQPGRGKGHRR